MELGEAIVFAGNALAPMDGQATRATVPIELTLVTHPALIPSALGMEIAFVVSIPHVTKAKSVE